MSDGTTKICRCLQFTEKTTTYNKGWDQELKNVNDSTLYRISDN